MKKRFSRSIVVLAMVGLFSGLLATPASAEPICTGDVQPITITVAGRDITIPGATGVCVDVPDPSTLPYVDVTTSGSGASTVVYITVVNSGTYSDTCMFGINGRCRVWFSMR